METELFKYIFLSLLYSLFFYLLYKVIVEKQTGYSQKRLYLVFAPLLSAVLPVLEFSKSQDPIFEIILPAIIVRSNGTNTIEQVDGKADFAGLFMIFYIAIATLFFVVLLFQISKIYIKVIRGDRERINGVTVVKCVKLISPFSYWNIIFIDADSKGDEYSKILIHEKAHIKYWHSADLTLVSILRCMQWFNPFIYLLNKELYAVQEFQADYEVIKSTGNINSYRELILKQQLGYSPVIVNSLRKSLTFKRLKEMEKSEKKSGRFYILPVAATLTLMFVFMVSTTQISKARINEIVNNSASSVIKAELPVINNITEQPDTIPFAIVEVKPKFMGGNEDTFTRWVFSKLAYPKEAIKQKMMGRVTVTFIVDSQGNVNNVKVVRGVSKILDEEAIRVIKMSPKWEPGIQKGKPVNVRYNFPVIFKLQ